jgi:hypothetical protein
LMSLSSGVSSPNEGEELTSMIHTLSELYGRGNQGHDVAWLCNKARVWSGPCSLSLLSSSSRIIHQGSDTLLKHLSWNLTCLSWHQIQTIQSCSHSVESRLAQQRAPQGPLPECVPTQAAILPPDHDCITGGRRTL